MNVSQTTKFHPSIFNDGVENWCNIVYDETWFATRYLTQILLGGLLQVFTLQVINIRNKFLSHDKWNYVFTVVLTQRIEDTNIF